MFLKVNVNEDVEFVLRKLSKKKNRDMAIIASDLLKEYVSEMDDKSFNESKKSENQKLDGPDVNLDMISISELKKRIEDWEKRFGPNSILINQNQNNISWGIKKHD